MITLLDSESIVREENDGTREFTLLPNIDASDFGAGVYVYTFKYRFHPKSKDESTEIWDLPIVITTDKQHSLRAHIQKIVRNIDYFWNLFKNQYQNKILRMVYYKLDEVHSRPQIAFADAGDDMVVKPLNAVASMEIPSAPMLNSLGFDTGYDGECKQPLYRLYMFIDIVNEERITSVIDRCEEAIKRRNVEGAVTDGDD